jgi:hypothetical protein
VKATGAQSTRDGRASVLEVWTAPSAVTVAAAAGPPATRAASVTIEESGTGVYRMTVGGTAGDPAARPAARAGAFGSQSSIAVADSAAAARRVVRSGRCVIRVWACGIGRLPVLV